MCVARDMRPKIIYVYDTYRRWISLGEYDPATHLGWSQYWLYRRRRRDSTRVEE